MVADADNKSELGSKINAKTSVFKKGGKGFWKARPRNPRILNGMAGRVDRFSAIGNGQVPAVVRLAWKILGPETDVVDAKKEAVK